MLIKAIFLAIWTFLLTTYSCVGRAQEIPCSGAPKDAVVEVPGNVRDLAAVTCTKYGHFLTGVDGTIWTYPGAMAPALLIADFDAANDKVAPAEVNHSKYFSSIKARDISPADTTALLADDGLPKPPAGTLITAVEISTINQDRVEQKAYIFSDGESRWGYLCDPKCKPNNTFMVLDMRHLHGGT